VEVKKKKREKKKKPPITQKWFIGKEKDVKTWCDAKKAWTTSFDYQRRQGGEKGGSSGGLGDFGEDGVKSSERGRGTKAGKWRRVPLGKENIVKERREDTEIVKRRTQNRGKRVGLCTLGNLAYAADSRTWNNKKKTKGETKNAARGRLL